MTIRLGIDLGDTRADLLLADGQTGKSYALKSPISGDDPDMGLAVGLTDLVRRADVSPGQIGAVVVALSGDLRAGDARVGLITTQGFEQALHQGRDVDRMLPTVGVPERISAAGDVVMALDDMAAGQAIASLLAQDVDVLAICLMHAHRNPLHEVQLRDLALARGAHLRVVLSHAVAPVPGEGARARATVLAAKAPAPVQKQLAGVRKALEAAQVPAELSIVQSTGDRIDAAMATDAPEHLAMAGSAAAAAAAAQAASSAGVSDAVALDLGGTAVSGVLIRRGAARIGEIMLDFQHPVPLPGVDVRGLGAGLHAIATSPVPGAVDVGPQSGSPACTGGDQPTVMDALAVSGRLPVDRLSLDVRAAEAAIGSVAGHMDVGMHRAAEAIVGIYVDKLAGAVRRLAVEKGEDPARMALIAGGGAGPTLGAEIAQIAGLWPVIVPRSAGAMSALGCAMAGTSRQFSAACGYALDAMPNDDLLTTIAGLRAKAETWLDSSGVRGSVAFRAEVAFRRSHFRTSVGFEPDTAMTADALVRHVSAKAIEAFHRRFGYAPDHRLEISTIRVIAAGDEPSLAPRMPTPDKSGRRASRLDQVQIWFANRFNTASVFDGDVLSKGNQIEGPAMILQNDTTVIVPPGCSAEMDGHENIVLNAASSSADRQH